MSKIETDAIEPSTGTTLTVGASGDTAVIPTGAKLDINGTELILDADADTSITADTDDQIDIKIAGADDFQFTANTFTAQSGSTIAAQALTATTIGATGVVTIPDGSVSAPAISNSGDANTGIYFPAADTVGVTAGGTEQFRFGSNPIPGSRKNLLINGNFDIWQRGGGTFTTGNEYTADMWKWAGTAGSGNVSRQAFTVGQTDVPGNPTYFWRGTIGTGDTSITVFTGIEGVGHGSGVPVTVSLWAKASETTGWLDGASGATLVQRYGTGGSTATRVELDGTFQSQAITTSWQKFVATATPASISGKTLGAGNNLELYLTTDADLSSSATLDIAQVQVEYGSVATDFDAGGDVGTILQKCQRYFVLWGTGAGWAISGTCRSTTSGYLGGFNFPVEMRADPTITYTTVNVIDSSASGVDGTLSTSAVNVKSATCSLVTTGLTDGNGLIAELKAGGTVQASAEL